MNDPTKDNEPAKNFEILCLSYSDETIYCDGYIYGQEFNLRIDPTTSDWDRFLPKHPPEYKLADENGKTSIRLDGFFNLHFLVELFDSHVVHSVVYIEPILEQLAEESLGS